MNSETHIDTDLIVQAFAYQARQLATTQASLAPYAQYEQILSEAEKHRSALRLAERDVFQATAHELRKEALTKMEAERMRESASQAVSQALLAISRIAAQYAPQKLAA